jgi:hypothetical protein
VHCQLTDRLLHLIGAEAAQPAAYSRLRRLVPVGHSITNSIMVIESHQFCCVVQARASDQGFDCKQQGRPVAVAGTCDLEWQVRLDQDRELFDKLPRSGIAGSNFAEEAGGLDQLDSSLPAWDVRQLDENRDLRSELPGGRDHPGSATGKIIEITQGRLDRRNLDAWGVVPRQSKQAAGAAADDHADRDAGIGRNLSSELGEPTVWHDQGCEQTPVRTAKLAVAGEHCRQRGLWSPYQGLVVKQAVEQLHDQQATQSASIDLRLRNEQLKRQLRASEIATTTAADPERDARVAQNRGVSRFPRHEVAEALAKVRAVCLALPETSERPSHGGPAFFIRNKKCFVMFLNNHHDDGRLAIWCAAPDGVQTEMVETEPERFFRPPYVGHIGWLGVQLPGIDDGELSAICQEAFATVAPPSVLKMWRSQPAG